MILQASTCIIASSICFLAASAPAALVAGTRPCGFTSSAVDKNSCSEAPAHHTITPCGRVCVFGQKASTLGWRLDKHQVTGEPAKQAPRELSNGEQTIKSETCPFLSIHLVRFRYYCLSLSSPWWRGRCGRAP